jgi:IS66 Orf2 like protein
VEATIQSSSPSPPERGTGIFDAETTPQTRPLGFIDMPKGIDGLAMLVQGVLRQDPFTGHLSVFQGRTTKHGSFATSASSDRTTC